VKQLQYTPAGYWDRRYREGRTSGAGSEGDEGSYKAKYVSGFIRDHSVESVIDWGCGDGQVLDLVDLHGADYLGVDVSLTIVERMRAKFPQHEFVLNIPEIVEVPNELSLSLDVLFHLPDDNDYFTYLEQLFESAERFVMIYSTNYAGGLTARHVFRREFTPDIARMFGGWELKRTEQPLREGLASFFVYEKAQA
jgi:SAM-dependent methyltransferase